MLELKDKIVKAAETLRDLCAEFDTALDALIPPSADPTKTHESIRHISVEKLDRHLTRHILDAQQLNEAMAKLTPAEKTLLGADKIYIR
jgi:hypothetical protein